MNYIIYFLIICVVYVIYVLLFKDVKVLILIFFLIGWEVDRDFLYLFYWLYNFFFYVFNVYIFKIMISFLSFMKIE